MNWTQLPTTAVVDGRSLEMLVDHVDHGSFDTALLDFLSQSDVSVGEVCGIGMVCGARAEAVGWAGRRADAGLRAQALAQRFSGRDPLLCALPAQGDPNHRLVGTLRVGALKDQDHRWLCFDQPDFRMRISVATAQDKGWAIFNIYLAESDATEAQLLHLASLASLAIPLIRRHSGWQNRSVDAIPGKNTAEHLVSLLGRRFPSLTQRERHVCAMTVMGKDSSTIASQLAITRNTVLTYRRRAYERLGVSSASALLVELV
ncbi:helix-turn-helix transcriptional regulator [Sphingomonas sp. BGYR3]|uniref:helix-turn-helix transcriptional regulator n=1 Tax=Sphingomonas sp. BGYR3 TaxID=2975483 RepID=UPI0021A28931|nr:helix-turn-helix transcriptional regulator [Sphingomonas sp. BGYR3]MDG5487782.1 helix-turn-helix transcriptional regulator [Sphingomonas sp. BGYR3]